MPEDPKKPKTPPPKISDRDERREYHRTPVGGSPPVIPSLRPGTAPESWEGNDALTGVPEHVPPQPSGATPRPRTLSAHDMLVDVDRRSKETKNVSIETKRVAASTLDRINDVRKELREDVKDTNEKVEATNTKVDALISVLGELREEFGRLQGTTTTFIDEIKLERNAQQQHKILKLTTELDLDKAEKLSSIKLEEADKLTDIDLRKKRWELVSKVVWKVVAGAGVVSSAILAAIVGGKC